MHVFFIYKFILYFQDFFLVCMTFDYFAYLYHLSHSTCNHLFLSVYPIMHVIVNMYNYNAIFYTIIYALHDL